MHKKLIYGTIILGVVLLSGYFIARTMIRNKIAEALRQLPPSIHLSYGALDYSLLKGNIDGKDIHITFTPDSTHQHKLHISNLTITSLGLISYLRHHDIHIQQILIQGCTAHLDQYLLDHQPQNINITPTFPNTAIGQLVIQDINITTQQAEVHQASLTLDTIHLNAGPIHLNANSLHNVTPQIQHINLTAANIIRTIPNAYEKIHITGLTLDSRAFSSSTFSSSSTSQASPSRASSRADSRATSRLHIDTARITPTINKTEIGRKLGQQTDCLTASSEDINIEELNLKALLQANTLQAAAINIAHNHIEIYRDRRLPRDTTKKPLPSAFLHSLPLTLRIGQINIGRSAFVYEEQPAKGTHTGKLEVLNLHGSIHPLINHPGKDDPQYITMKIEGSLMGSGAVTAITKLPLHKQDPYKVEGAFHDLDVTTLNPSAENLGLIHLESGMLNSLTFEFSMTDERSTGSIIGEYHNLVVQKLKGDNDNKKVDKVKSFFLRHLIIPKNKDRSLPIDKRTGKVDYKHDPTRYFSYYMLHSLLVGVKSSFKLGFLLPG